MGSTVFTPSHVGCQTSSRVFSVVAIASAGSGTSTLVIDFPSRPASTSAYACTGDSFSLDAGSSFVSVTGGPAGSGSYACRAGTVNATVTGGVLTTTFQHLDADNPMDGGRLIVSGNLTCP